MSPIRIKFAINIAWASVGVSLATAIVLLSTIAPAADSNAEPKRVLLLHSYGPDFSPWAEFTRSFRVELGSRFPKLPELYDASLQSERLGGAQDEAPFVDYLRALFINRRLDLIVPVGAPAARFVQRYRQQLFETTPMLLTAVDWRRAPLTALGPNDSLVATSVDFVSVVKNILDVLPDTTNIFVVMGNSPVEKFWLEEVRRGVQPYTSKVAFTWSNDLSFEEMLTRVSALPPNSAIFFASLSVDAKGISHPGVGPFARLRSVANAPIFSYVDTNFGAGIVGGSMLGVDDTAQQAANVAMRILNGEPAAGIRPPPVEHGAPKYDWRELRRWGIDEGRLPSGSEIYFRPPSVWEQYWWQLVSVMAIVLLQAAVIALLLFERQRRQRAETESRNRLAEVIHLNRTAAAGVLSASFSHELNQPLGAILSNAEAAEILLSTSPPDLNQVREILADIRRDDQRAGDIIRHLGGLLKRMQHSELKLVDLNETIAGAIEYLSLEAAKRNVLLKFRRAPAALPVRADAVHLQQVIVNLVLNGLDAVLSSAMGSREIEIETVLTGSNQVRVAIADTGIGIPDERLNQVFETFFTTKPQGTGLGLSIARTVIENYGGKIWAENRPGSGAVFIFTLPLSKGN